MMHSQFASRGVERREFTDPETGRVVQQLTCNEALESKHAYYDIRPWNHDEQYLVFSSARPEELTAPHRTSLTTSDGQICVMAVDSGEIFTVAEGAFYNCHVGTFPMWRPDQNIIYFSRTADEIGFVDIDSGHTGEISGAARQISPDGEVFAGLSDQLDHEVATPGVCRMNVDGSDAVCLATTRQLYELTPNKHQFDFSEMRLSNTKWTPDGQHMLVALAGYPRPGVRRSIYIVSRDGSEARWLTHFGHHHSWTPDGRRVLFNDWLIWEPDGTKREPRMHFIDFDGTNRHIAIDEPIGSHPIMSPDGRAIADWDRDGVYRVHLEEQRIERLVQFRQPFHTGHKGTHPHCLWNPSGTALLYNSAETGHGEVYQVQLAD